MGVNWSLNLQDMKQNLIQPMTLSPKNSNPNLI
jgi:hypothetical protein